MQSRNIAAIYVRVSTRKESQRDSPEHQRMVCEEKALMENLDVRYVYEDLESGTSIVGRSEIQQLMHDAQQGLFDTIIFASLSRFSRDLLDSVALKRMLVDALNLRLISLDENYDSRIDRDELKFQIISSVNQKLSESIAISSRRGKRQSAKNGNFTGSIAPYGYTKVNKNNEDGTKVKSLEMNEHAETVKLIFELYVNHKLGVKNIARILNEEKQVPAPAGGMWGVTTIQRILQNEAYIGYHVFSKFTVKKVYNNLGNLHDRQSKLVRRDKATWERQEGKQWEAIIADSVFRKAQEIRLMRGGGQRGGTRVKVNLFAGIIHCAHCGSSMSTMLSGAAGSYRYLICSKRRRQGNAGCTNSLWLPYEPFKRNFLQGISCMLAASIDPENIARERSAKLILQAKPDSKKERAKLTKKIQECRGYLFQIRRHEMAGKIDQAQFHFEKKQYENEIASAQQKLQRLMQGDEAGQDHLGLQGRIKQALEDFVQLKLDNKDELRLMVRKIVDKIIVDQQANIEIHTPFDPPGSQ